MKNKGKIVFLLVAVLFLVAIFIVVKKQKVVESVASDSLGTTQKVTNDISVTGPGNVKVEVVPVKKSSALPVPDLNRAIKYPASMSQEERMIVGERIKKDLESLKNDPSSFDAWLGLGIDYKTIGDYEGAREAWEYAHSLDTRDFVSLTNLGDLYGYYLKDNANAEKNYLKSIENNPGSSNLYIRLADFYREVVFDLKKAKAILEQGLKNVPDDLSLKQALEQVDAMLKEKNTETKSL